MESLTGSIYAYDANLLYNSPISPLFHKTTDMRVKHYFVYVIYNDATASKWKFSNSDAALQHYNFLKNDKEHLGIKSINKTF